MCGIAGYYGSRILGPERIQECLRRMRRRGPDHADFYHHRFSPDRSVYLLHSRLSIIDLDPRSHQPFRDGSRVMVYNGEMYNYLELRQELLAAGEEFRTSSDTEVLLRVIARRGWPGLDRCEGMWAFAVYDESDGSLLLSRDRFAEKPLYLHSDESGVYFGSEPKFIAALLNRRLPVNRNHLLRYLVNGYRSLYKSRETFFKELEEMEPASVLRIQADGKQERHFYWRPRFEPDENMTYEQAVEGVREAVLESVRLRLRADVPLAFCMSGGVDSTSLISAAKRVHDYDVHAFTVMNTDACFDEGEMVAETVRELGIRHTAVPVTTERFLDRMAELIRYHDAPVHTISYYAHWLLMEAVARQGYRVSVSGTGGDELLAGYYDHQLMYLAEVRNTDLWEPARRAWESHVAPLVRNPYLKDPDRFCREPGFRGHLYMDSERFAGFLADGWKEEFSEVHYTDSLLRNRMMNEMFTEAVRVILHEDDLNAMYFSIENRSPFLDRTLFEFCQRIPTRYLIQDGYGKAILRDAMRGIAPDHVLWNRRKVGFNAPIFSFLDPRDSAVRERVLDDGPIYRLVRKPAVESLLAVGANGGTLPERDSMFLFSFLSAKIFLEEFEP